MLSRFPLSLPLLLLTAHHLAAAPFNFTPVAVTAQPAPGLAPGISFNFFSAPALNSAGQCVFQATLVGSTVTSANNFSLWVGAPGQLTLLARQGDPAPGTASGVVYSTFAQRRIDPLGRCAFDGFVSGANVTVGNNRAIWWGPAGRVALLARDGDPAPGAGSGVFFGRVGGIGLGGPTLNVNGQTAFTGWLNGANVVTPGNERGLWMGVPGGVSLLVRSGDPVPGSGSGITYADFSSAAMNGAGQITFGASVRGEGVTELTRGAIVSGTANNLGVVVRAGNIAPDTGAAFSYLGNLTINSAGTCSFFGKVTGSGISTANDFGLWSGPPTNLALLARKGDAAPGMATGVTIRNFGAATSTQVRQTPRIDAQGRTAFLAFVTGPGVTTANDSGIWRGVPGSVQPIMREGDPAPGLSDGALFGDGTDVSDGDVNDIAVNDRGEMIFFNRLTGPNVTTANDGSIWHVDATGALSLIVREGDSFQVAPGDTRTVRVLSFTGGSGDEDGNSCGFNDAGQLAFYVTFIGGTEGVFIAAPVGLSLTQAVSRKMHGGLGPFDIPLPLTGSPGVECRSSGGNHTLVFSFSNNVVAGSASITTGVGSVAGSPTFSGNTMTVNVTGVADVQRIGITLSGVTDSFAQVLPDVTVSMNLLIGDTNGNKTVNATDVGQTKASSGTAVTSANFRQDVTPNGSITASDLGLVKSRAGATVP